MSRFIGRKAELARLAVLLDKPSASLVVVKGRRRIGKSRLVEEFAKTFDHFYRFSGLPPEAHTTTVHQLDEFSRQITHEFQTAKARYDDWSDAFWALGERVTSGRTLILFDEISWMGSKDSTFLGKIKNLWDTHLKQNDQLTFVVCGSASSWIEKNVLSSTGFVGRISLTLTLEELPLVDCAAFWPAGVSAYEKFKVLSVTGGVPKYLEEILPHQSAEENIKRLCFEKGGFLVDEFEKIFSDIFIRQSDYYVRIVKALLDGAKNQHQICDVLGVKRHGRIVEYLEELVLAGFVTKDHAWQFKTGQDSEIRRYRLSDNYLRFYLKYIEKHLSKIDRNAHQLQSLVALPEWRTVMGFQFESLVLHNRSAVQSALGLYAGDVTCENPYIQRPTKRHPGCQIDYLIQTRFDVLYVCEIKFSKRSVGAEVIESVQQKIDRLVRPKGFSCRPVLIHVNGVTDELKERSYFASIIDASQWLSPN